MDILDLPQTDATAGSATQAASGIAAGTLVLTAAGECLVEDLAPGARIITRTGIRHLRQIRRQDLTGAAVRVSASTLGHGRPEADVILAPAQMLYLRDWRAEALFGTATAIVPVSRLIDAAHVCPIAVERLAVFTLGFDAPCVVYAAGLELACGAC